jgi:rSAM/selenodomain-associated transferase 1
MTALVVIAKSPVPGRSKTRLSPPCTPDEAAAIAEACLRDTLDAACAVHGAQPVLLLDGPRPPWFPSDVDLLPQRGRGLDERLAAGFADVGEPAVMIAMDTPQVTPAMLARATRALETADAVLAEAVDGGYWAIGLRRPDPRAILGVPMSTSRTAEAQRHRLRALGLSVAHLPRLRDVDTFEDAIAVAREAPDTRLAALLEPAAIQ